MIYEEDRNLKISERFNQGNVKIFVKKILEENRTLYYSFTKEQLLEYSFEADFTKYEDMPKEMYKIVSDTILATIYIEKFAPKHVTERVRNGYVGKEIIKDGVTYYQHEKGQPFGSLVSISDEKGGVSIGVDILSKSDNVTPRILSEYRAVRDAENRLKEHGGGVYIYRKDEPEHEINTQLDHFYMRSLAYWNPEKYSYSRGSVPVNYKNFDKIHEFQEKVLGKSKIRESMSRIPTSDFPKLKCICTDCNSQEDLEKYVDTANNYDYLISSNNFTLKHNEKVILRNKRSYDVIKGDWIVRNHDLWELIPSENIPKKVKQP